MDIIYYLTWTGNRSNFSPLQSITNNRTHNLIEQTLVLGEENVLSRVGPNGSRQPAAARC